MKSLNKLIMFLLCLSLGLSINFAWAQQGAGDAAKDFFKIGCELKNKNKADLKAFSEAFFSRATNQEKQNALLSFLINPCDGKLNINKEQKNKDGSVTVIGGYENSRGKNTVTFLLAAEDGQWKVVSREVSERKSEEKNIPLWMFWKRK